MDPIAEIAEITVAVTKPGRRSEAFRESSGVRGLCRPALAMLPGTPRKQAWKGHQKLRRGEHRTWKTDKYEKAGAGYWKSKKAADSDGHITTHGKNECNNQTHGERTWWTTSTKYSTKSPYRW